MRQPTLFKALPAWTPLGPSPILNGQVTGGIAISGRVTALQIDSNNSNKVCVGTTQGGICRSLDAGATWVQIFDDTHVGGEDHRQRGRQGSVIRRQFLPT